MIILDTTIVIDQLRGREDAGIALRQAASSGERLLSSVVTRAEVIAGVRPNEVTTTTATLAGLVWIPVDEEIAELAGWLANTYRPAHNGIDLMDFIIAATAQRLDATVWTRNVKHFPMFPDLRAPY